jgi:aminoglycoside phosphotransferase (APT) family kinase protein
MGAQTSTSVSARSAGATRDEAVAGQLLDFLAVPGLRYRTRPTPLLGGWETYTYGLEFEPEPALPLLRGPLVLRIYATDNGTPRARHEFAVQSFVHGHGFPAPRPLLLVQDDEPFGGPFLLMERLSGGSLLETLRQRPWRLWDLPGRMADLHARLHQLPPDGFPDADGDLLDRSLNEIRARVTAYGLYGLRPGIDWLLANRPERTGTPRPLHLDWHPMNLIYSGGNLYGLDWTEADVGDRHADVATTLLMLLGCPMPAPVRWQRPFVPLARGVVARRYLRAYRRRLPLDGTRLNYYGAWAALRRLARYGRWLSVGPGSTGCKPSALRHVGPAHCETLCHYFARHSGVEVKLDCEGR